MRSVLAAAILCLLLLASGPARADVAVAVDITYGGCAIAEGPLSLGLSEFPGEIEARVIFRTPVFPTSGTLEPEVLFYQLVVGDLVVREDDLELFRIGFFPDPDGGLDVSELSYLGRVAETDSACGVDMPNSSFSLDVTGTTRASPGDPCGTSGELFRYHCASSTQTFGETSLATGLYEVTGDTDGTAWRFRLEGLDASCRVIEAVEGSSTGIPATGDPVAGAIAFTTALQTLIQQTESDFFAPITGTKLLELSHPVATELRLGFGRLDGAVSLISSGGVEIPNPLVAHVGGTPFGCPVLAIDVQPDEEEPSSVNLGKRGRIAVALLGSESLDVLGVDVSTLAFGPGRAAPIDKDGGQLEDVNLDGFPDLVSHYLVGESGIALGDTQACVSAELLDGRAVGGCDTIATIERQGPK